MTIAETLKAAGYATAHVGKWHLVYAQPTMPLAQGFDRSFGHMGGCIDNYSHYFDRDGPNRHDLRDDGREVHNHGHLTSLHDQWLSRLSPAPAGPVASPSGNEKSHRIWN